jgi:hypothetical protein
VTEGVFLYACAMLEALPPPSRCARHLPRKRGEEKDARLGRGQPVQTGLKGLNGAQRSGPGERLNWQSYNSGTVLVDHKGHQNRSKAAFFLRSVIPPPTPSGQARRTRGEE